MGDTLLGVYAALYADRMLIGAWNPLLWPILGLQVADAAGVGVDRQRADCLRHGDPALVREGVLGGP